MCFRTPAEQRVIETGPDGQDPQKQEWFTKYFSFWGPTEHLAVSVPTYWEQDHQSLLFCIITLNCKLTPNKLFNAAHRPNVLNCYKNKEIYAFGHKEGQQDTKVIEWVDISKSWKKRMFLCRGFLHWCFTCGLSQHKDDYTRSKKNWTVLHQILHGPLLINKMNCQVWITGNMVWNVETFLKQKRECKYNWFRHTMPKL